MFRCKERKCEAGMSWDALDWAGLVLPALRSPTGGPSPDPAVGQYLVNSEIGAQLLPSGKQKRGMAWRRRSSSSFWPFSKFSRWKEEMPRVRELEGPHCHQEWGGIQWNEVDPKETPGSE